MSIFKPGSFKEGLAVAAIMMFHDYCTESKMDKKIQEDRDKLKEELKKEIIAQMSAETEQLAQQSETLSQSLPAWKCLL